MDILEKKYNIKFFFFSKMFLPKMCELFLIFLRNDFFYFRKTFFFKFSKKNYFLFFALKKQIAFTFLLKATHAKRTLVAIGSHPQHSRACGNRCAVGVNRCHHGQDPMMTERQACRCAALVMRMSATVCTMYRLTCVATKGAFHQHTPRLYHSGCGSLMDQRLPLRSVPARCSVVHSVALARNLPCKRFRFILRLVEASLEVVALFFL